MTSFRKQTHTGNIQEDSLVDIWFVPSSLSEYSLSPYRDKKGVPRNRNVRMRISRGTCGCGNWLGVWDDRRTRSEEEDRVPSSTPENLSVLHAKLAGDGFPRKPSSQLRWRGGGGGHVSVLLAGPTPPPPYRGAGPGTGFLGWLRVGVFRPSVCRRSGWRVSRVGRVRRNCGRPCRIFWNRPRTRWIFTSPL